MVIKTKHAIEFAGNKSKLAAIVGISRQAVRTWGTYVPQTSAWKLHILSDYNLGRKGILPEEDKA